MWPFKKRPLLKKTSDVAINSVICIPGNWNSWDEFILSIIKISNGEFMAVGNILFNSKENWHCTVEFCEKDERMTESFKAAGKTTRITESTLAEIDSHKHVIYLIGAGGSMENAARISRAGAVILKTGGIGIKIESAGKALEKGRWISLTEAFDPANLYEMFVIDSIVLKDGSVYSCGMHNLGLKDTIISGEEFQSAVNLITIFNYYQIIDKPVIKNNQTFTAAVGHPRYRITEELKQPYKGDDLFENPFGMWRLAKDIL